MATTYDDDALVIVPSRFRYLLLTVGSLLLGAISGLLVVAGAASGFRTVALLVGVPFFLVCGVCYGRRLVSPSPTLRIDASGVYDASSLTAVGFVPWEDVDGVAFESVTGQTLLRVRVSNWDAHLDRVSRPKRALLRLNGAFMGESSAFYVAFDNVGASADDIAASIRRHSRFDPDP